MGQVVSIVITSAKFVSFIDGNGVPTMKKQYGIGNGHLELPLRGKKHYIVFGGPFTEAPRDTMVSVKMAAEIKMPCDISIPTPDFQVPPKDVIDKGKMKEEDLGPNTNSLDKEDMQ